MFYVIHSLLIIFFFGIYFVFCYTALLSLAIFLHKKKEILCSLTFFIICILYSVFQDPFRFLCSIYFEYAYPFSFYSHTASKRFSYYLGTFFILTISSVYHFYHYSYLLILLFIRCWKSFIFYILWISSILTSKQVS